MEKIDLVFQDKQGEMITAYRVMMYVGGRGHILCYSLFKDGKHVSFIDYNYITEKMNWN